MLELTFVLLLSTPAPLFDKGASRPAPLALFKTCQISSHSQQTIAACTAFLNKNRLAGRIKRALAYVHRGHAFLEEKRFDRALSDFEQAIKINPKNPQAYFYRGSAYSQIGKHQQAIKAYDRAIHLQPDFVEAYFNRGTAYGRLRNFTKSIADLSAAIGFDPALGKAYANRGAAHAYLQHWQQALKDFDRAVQLAPQQAAVWLNRAEIYRIEGQRQKALQDYLKGFALSHKKRVRLLQKRLQRNDGYPGALDGLFNPETRQFLKKCLANHAFDRHKL